MVRLRSLVVAVVLLAVLSPPWAARADDPPPSDVIALRTRVFGRENVDPQTGAVRPDRVILSWFGVTSFAASLAGHVVLLDAWVPRGEYSGYVPTSPQEMAALRPEAVFIGHGHFDHAADIGTILDGSGATSVGTPEHCAFARTQVSPGTEVHCVDAAPAGAPMGVRTDIDLWRDIGITAVVHPHSARESRDTSDPHSPLLPVPGVDTMVLHPADPADSALLAQHAGDAEGGTLLYQFRIGKFALTWHDSTGPLPELAPDLFANAHLGPTDVEVGAIVGFNQYANGMRDPRLYVEALHPKIFVPAHHDNWLPPVTGHASEYEAPLRAELAKLDPASQPEIRYLYDPTDYLRPSVLTFSWKDRVWRDT